MSSIYGERHSAIVAEHTATRGKLDLLLAKTSEVDVNTDTLEAKHDTGNASLASVDGKITAVDTGACVIASSALPAGASSEATMAALSAKVTAVDTGACVVASSALPAGASSEAKQDALIGHVDGIEGLILATNNALAGTLTVSAPAIVKSTQQVFASQSVAPAASHSSSEIDLGLTKHIAILASCGDTTTYSALDLLASPTSGGTFFETSHSGFYSEGFFYVHAKDIPFRYVKLRVKNTGGSADAFTAHILKSS